MIDWKIHIAQLLKEETNITIRAGEDYPPFTQSQIEPFLKELRKVEGISPKMLILPLADPQYEGEEDSPIACISLGPDIATVWHMHVVSVHALLYDKGNPWDDELHMMMENLRGQLFLDYGVFLIGAQTLMADLEMKLEASGAI